MPLCEEALKAVEYLPSSEEALKNAKKNRQKVRTPAEDELLLDFDNSVDYDFFEKQLSVLGQYWGVEKHEQYPSISGKPGHLHVIVKLKAKVTPLERIALQACLGSDRKRELLGIVMLHNHDPFPTFLIRSK